LDYLKRWKQRNETVGLFLVDQRMPEMSGVEFLSAASRRIRRQNEFCSRLMRTPRLRLIRSTKSGSHYYLMKPGIAGGTLYPICDELL